MRWQLWVLALRPGDQREKRSQSFGAIRYGSMRVLKSEFESRFPQAMVFTLDAATLRPIQKVTVSYRVGGRRTLIVGDAPTRPAVLRHEIQKQARHRLIVPQQRAADADHLRPFMLAAEAAQHGRQQQQSHGSHGFVRHGLVSPRMSLPARVNMAR